MMYYVETTQKGNIFIYRDINIIITDLLQGSKLNIQKHDLSETTIALIKYRGWVMFRKNLNKT